MIYKHRHLIFAAVVVIVLVGLRVLITGPADMDDLQRFEIVTGANVGPDAAFFASGLNGDGATFTVVALDPLGNDLGHLLRKPSYRYMRFGYPWIARGVVLGTESLVLLGLSVTGMAAAGLTAFLASRVSEIRGVWAWLLIANPALILGVLKDTAEPLGVALLALAALTGSTTVAIALAVVRPTFLVAVAGRWRIFLIGVGVAVISKTLWSWHFGESPATGGFNLDWPLAGVLASPSILGWILMALAMATAMVGVLRRDWAWVISGVFVLCFGPVVVDTPTNAVRAAGFLPVLWAFGPQNHLRFTLRAVFATSQPLATIDSTHR